MLKDFGKILKPYAVDAGLPAEFRESAAAEDLVSDPGRAEVRAAITDQDDRSSR